MSFRFVHTADIHLDSPLRTLALRDREIAELVSNATRGTFERIIDLCINESVDALLIAGDLFDGELRSMKTAAFFSNQMRRLTSAGIEAYILRGNHDAVSKLTRHLNLPSGVFMFPDHPDSFEVKGKNTFLHGLSFARPKMPDNLVPQYPPPVDGAINIGLLHTSLAGSSQHDTYSPCSLEDLANQGYDYWALGHIHKREQIMDAPQAIVMPGCPQGRHINEAGPKSVSLIEISDDHEIKITEHRLAIARFERLDIDLSDLLDWSEMVEYIRSVLAAKQSALSSEHLIVRLELTGETQLSARLHRDDDQLAEELRQAIPQKNTNGANMVLIEEIRIQTKRPTAPIKTDIPSPDPLLELRQIALEPKMIPSLADQDFAQLLSRLTGKLPPELRDEFSADHLKADDRINQIFENGLEIVLAKLENPGDPD